MFARPEVTTPLNPAAQAGESRSPNIQGFKHPKGSGVAKVSDTWFFDAPSRQTMDASTAASECDMQLGASCSPVVAQLPRGMERLREQRGWKHFFKHVLAVPLALGAGCVMGSALTAAVVAGVRGRGRTYAPTAPTVVYPYALAAPPTEVPPAYLASPPLNNSCLIPELTLPDGPQRFDACGFVIRSTDEVWNLRGDVDAAINKYFDEDYLDAGSWGRRIMGRRALRDAILSEMRAFPDIRIHITDCACRGNDVDGYKCAMPDILSGTNLGPSAYGPPTGRYARWTGMVQSFIKKNAKTGRWQYVAEWGVHDEWALIQQLGLDFARVPHPLRNTEPLHDCTPLLRLNPTGALDALDGALQRAQAQSKSLRSS